jgi:lipid A ethanolaminephosphotransferase
VKIRFERFLKTLANVFGKTPSAGSYVFILLIALWSATALNIPFYDYVADNFSIRSLKALVFVCTLPFFFFAVSLLIVNLLFLPYIGKAIFALLTIISAVAGYYMMTFGILIDADMIQNVFETSKREAFDLITFPFAIRVMFLGVIPAILILVFKVKFLPLKYELILRGVFFISSLIIIGFSALVSFRSYADFRKEHKEQLPKIITPINYVYHTAKYIQRIRLLNKELHILDADAKFNGERNVSQEHKVLVIMIGETSRAANFQLGGYDRETNPKLTALSDLVYFKNTSSCATATGVSVPCMFSYFERKNFDITDAKFTENIIDLANKTGYKVIWKNNNDDCKGVCDRVMAGGGIINVKELNFSADYCDKDYCFDGIFLRDFADELKAVDRDTIFVFHTIGSHGPKYYKRYPDKFRVFKPTCDTAQIHDCDRESLINTYDNTIYYADFVIESVIDALDDAQNLQSALIYASDHGESLGEAASFYKRQIAASIKGQASSSKSSGIYLHGMPYTIAPEEQIKVPMLLWLDNDFLNAEKIDLNCLQTNAKTGEFSHDFLFHSLLTLLDIETKLYKSELDFIAPCKKR